MQKVIAGLLAASVAVVGFTFFGTLPGSPSSLEVMAVVTGAWSVWLLAQNRALGWWIALVSIAAFGVVFYRVRLFAEVGIQIFYFFTSMQAIWIWMRGGAQGQERRVTRLPRRILLWTLPVFLVSLVLLRWVLIEINGAAPFWDALSTVMSLTAHIYLMLRFVESWWIWIAVDLIYVPLYASRGLPLTSMLYVGFLLISISGLRRFRRLAGEDQ